MGHHWNGRTFISARTTPQTPGRPRDGHDVHRAHQHQQHAAHGKRTVAKNAKLLYSSTPSACPRQVGCPPLRSGNSDGPADNVRQFRGTIHTRFAPNRANHTNNFQQHDETGVNARKHECNDRGESPAALQRRDSHFELDQVARPGTLCETTRQRAEYNLIVSCINQQQLYPHTLPRGTESISHRA